MPLLIRQISAEPAQIGRRALQSTGKLGAYVPLISLKWSGGFLAGARSKGAGNTIHFQALATWQPVKKHPIPKGRGKRLRTAVSVFRPGVSPLLYQRSLKMTVWYSALDFSTFRTHLENRVSFKAPMRQHPGALVLTTSLHFFAI
jgi:hypothetical protein